MRHKSTLIIIAAVAILVLLSASIYYFFFTFRVTGTTPNTSSIMSATPFLTIKFNKSISSVGSVVGYDSQRADLVESWTIEGSTIKISLANLSQDKATTILLKDIKNSKTYAIAQYQLKFSPQATDSTKMTSAELDEALKRQDKFDSKDTDPILSILPYQTTNYNLAAVEGPSDTNNQPTYKIALTISLSAGEVRSDQQFYTDLYKNQATEFLQSKAVDLTKYPLEVTVQTASLY